MGSSEVAKIRTNLAGHLPEIINALVTAAKGGDISAVKLIFDRTIPVLRAEELPIALRGAMGAPANLIARVIEAIATARIDVDRGAPLVALLAPLEIEARVAAVERVLNPPNDGES